MNETFLAENRSSTPSESRRSSAYRRDSMAPSDKTSSSSSSSSSFPSLSLSVPGPLGLFLKDTTINELMSEGSSEKSISNAPPATKLEKSAREDEMTAVTISTLADTSTSTSTLPMRLKGLNDPSILSHLEIPPGDQHNYIITCYIQRKTVICRAILKNWKKNHSIFFKMTAVGITALIFSLPHYLYCKYGPFTSLTA